MRLHKTSQSPLLSLGLSCLIVGMTLSACMPIATPYTPPGQPPAPQTFAQQEQTLTGNLILPYQISDSAQMRTASLNTSAEIRSLKAKIDDQPVSLTIHSISPRGNETYISYTMSGFPRPLSTRVYTVEVLNDAGDPILGGVVSLRSNQAVVYDLDLTSTALLIRAREKYQDRRLLSVNLSEIDDLKRDPELVDLKLSLGSVLRSTGQLTKDIIGAVFQGLADLRRQR